MLDILCFMPCHAACGDESSENPPVKAGFVLRLTSKGKWTPRYLELDMSGAVALLERTPKPREQREEQVQG